MRPPADGSAPPPLSLSQRELLDQLMGGDRNAALPSRRAGKEPPRDPAAGLDDPALCPYHLAGLCPYRELFGNTRWALGDCGFVKHDAASRARFAALPTRGDAGPDGRCASGDFARRRRCGPPPGPERLLLSKLRELQSTIDREIERGRERARMENAAKLRAAGLDAEARAEEGG